MTKALYTLVGMQHRGSLAFVKNMPDREQVFLVREPANRYDQFAVAVWARGPDDVFHIGYIKGTEVPKLARLIDSIGQPAEEGRTGCWITGEFIKGDWPKIEVNE